MSFPTISKDHPLILASVSPRRKRLLKQIGLPFRARASNVAEKRSAAAPSAEALLLAEMKATAVRSGHRSSWILGADTVVVIEGKVLGKPGDHEEARSMLSLLSGKGHRVITGFCVLDPTGRIAHCEAVTTLVRMKSLSDEEIRAYVATREPLGKAGSYAIQGIGTFMIESISGSYTNVVGLPVCALIKCLLATGALECYPLSP